LQQKSLTIKFYINAWYLIVTQVENTPSKATVDINITQQNPTLKLVIQFEMKAKHSKRRSNQVFKMSCTSFHTLVGENTKSTVDAGKRRIPLLHTDVSVRACTSCRPFLVTSKSCLILLLSTVSY